jgi:hypothetical protein
LAEAVSHQTLVAVRDGIAALALEDVAIENVRWQKVPFDEGQLKDCPTVGGMVLCAPIPERMEGGTNARDDVGYGIQVVYAQRSGEPYLTANLSRLAKWRQMIRRTFHQKRLSVASATSVSDSGTSEIICTVEPGAVVLPGAFKNKIDAGALVVRCGFRESRSAS